MRAILLLLVFGGTAAADTGAGFFAQATRYANQPNRNFGAAVELSIDRGRMQYLAEGAVAAVSFGRDFYDGISGTLYRGALGTRYRARRFAIEPVDVDLGFEALIALQLIDWSAGGRELRPELAVGFSWSITAVEQITFRISLRAFFTPAPTSELACRGPCMTDDAITSGYMAVMGFAL